MDRFFEEAAEGRVPLAGPPPTDPEVLERLGAFTEKYGTSSRSCHRRNEGRPHGRTS
jgi:hypothetical protein